MTSWYDTFDAVFFTGIATMAFGGLAVCLRYGFMSKCDNIQFCWGAITIHRAVDLEQQADGDDDLATQQHGRDDEHKSGVELRAPANSAFNKV